MSNLIQAIEAEQLRTDIPEFGPGDTVVVKVKVREGDRERLQAFEGFVIAKKNRGINSSFTVRKISYGEGVKPYVRRKVRGGRKLGRHLFCLSQGQPLGIAGTRFFPGTHRAL